MKKIVSTNLDNCVGCNRCTRECPIEMANLTYQDENGKIKVRVDNTKCIACGACIPVCKHDARIYADDTERFFADLQKGEKISLIAAPSLRTNLPEWKRILAFLKKEGVEKVYDVSLGADICVWAHLRYLETHTTPIITQPCAAIVSYCEIHNHALLKYLSPVHSPMGCTAVFMSRYEGITGKIAALSPCIAKGNEFEATELTEYNLTFARMVEYIQNNAISLPEEEAEFDHFAGGLGAVFPTPGGLKENLEFFAGRKYRIDRAEGFDVYKSLDLYANTPEELLPRVFDVLNCAEGCNIGSGCLQDKNFFEVQDCMEKTRQGAVQEKNKEIYEERYRMFDDMFSLEDYLREYAPLHTVGRQLSDWEIERAFAMMDKNTYVKQNFNCGACGSASCRDMARKIAMGINLPLNCIVKSRDDLFGEHNKNIELYRRNSKHMRLLHNIGDYLMSTGYDSETEGATRFAQELCDLLNAASAYIWRRAVDENGTVMYRRFFGWPETPSEFPQTLWESQLPEWFTELYAGRAVSKHRSSFNPEEENLFPDKQILSILVIPVRIKGEFWGFLNVNSRSDEVMDEEEISAIFTSGMLMVSGIMEREMTDSLIEAREAALAGTHAKSDFLSRMSHEMRTPMNAIIGMSKIAEGTEDLQKLRYCLSTIGTSATHLLGLINDILDMSKIEAGKFELDNAQFSVEKMLIKICNIIVEKAEQKNQKLSVTMGREMGIHYLGDELRLSQVITNLLGNATKFTPEGGTINIKVDEISRSMEGSVLRFSVTDSGIGMNQEQIGRLFNAFEQADRSITTRYGGTGLGLTISKSIVEKMGGRIWVTSEPGKGSSFQFEVLLAPCTVQDGKAILSGIKPSDVKLLVVDGDEEIRTHFAAIVDKFGMQYDMADAGKTALSFAGRARRQNRPYDVIFLDHQLPDMDGLVLAEQLEGLIDRNTVIIMTSFLEWSRIEKSARKAGISRFIAKPLFPSTVLDAINDVVGKAAKDLGIALPSAREASDLSGVHILLAEDIEINREIFTALLQETGIGIDVAENGRIAVQRFAENPRKYKAIVMDVQMPEMDGYEATRAIRALEQETGAHIPILAMTANAFTEDIKNCLESGMDDYLSKPIDEKALLEKLIQYTKN